MLIHMKKVSLEVNFATATLGCCTYKNDYSSKTVLNDWCKVEGVNSLWRQDSEVRSVNSTINLHSILHVDGNHEKC